MRVYKVGTFEYFSGIVKWYYIEMIWEYLRKFDAEAAIQFLEFVLWICLHKYMHIFTEALFVIAQYKNHLKY